MSHPTYSPVNKRIQQAIIIKLLSACSPTTLRAIWEDLMELDLSHISASEAKKYSFFLKLIEAEYLKNTGQELRAQGASSR